MLPIKKNGQFVLVLLSLLTLVSCGGSGTETSLDRPSQVALDSSTIQTGQQDGTPAGFDIGGIADLDRGASYTDEDRLLLGSQFAPTLPNSLVSTDGDSATFSPSYKPSLDSSLVNPAFAIYSFSLGDYDQAIQLIFGVSDGPETESDLYFAMANYASGRWEWHQGDGSRILNLPEYQDYISPEGHIFFCVAMTGLQQANLDFVRIGTGFPPEGTLLADVIIGDYPLDVTFTADFNDSDGEIVEYQWDYNNDGTIEETTSEAVHMHNFPVPGTFVTRVHAIDNEGMKGTNFRTINVTGVLPPNPPENVQASDGAYGDEIRVSWEKPSTGNPPKGFQIDRAPAPGGPFEMVGAVSFAFTEYSDTSVPDNATYWYRVISIHEQIGNSVPSNTDDGYMGFLDPPTNVICGQGPLPDKISISWQHPASGETPEGYALFRSTTPDGLKSFVANLGFLTFYQDTTVPDGQVYYYFLQSTRADFPNSGYSEAASGFVSQLQAPSNLQASDDASPDLVQLTWTHSGGSQVPAGYNIWRSDAEDGTYTKVAFVGYVNNWDDEDATDGATYWYKVDAYKVGWSDSAQSDPDSGYVGLSAPLSLNASDDEVFQVTVTWLPPADGPTPESYEVFRADVIDGPYTSIGTTTDTFFVDTDVLGLFYYYYYAVAKKTGYADSPASNIDEGFVSD